MQSKIFPYSDFRPIGAQKDWVPTSAFQKFLIDTMSNELEGVLKKLPKYSTIHIINGVRTDKCNAKVKRRRGVASEISDHLYGLPAPTANHPEVAGVFGDTLPMTLGAVDITVSGESLHKVFEIIVDLCLRCRVKFGQVILVTGGESKDHIHLSNDPMELFQPQLGKLLMRDKFQVSTDGGITLTTYEPPIKTRGRKAATPTL